LLLFVLSGCQKAQKHEEVIRSVKLVQVSGSNDVMTKTYAGEVRAKVESTLGFRLGGQLLSRQIELGSSVKSGQVLAVLDVRDLELAVASAKAQWQAAQSQRDLAQAEYQRFLGLRQQNFISAAELDRRATSLKAAQASFEQAQALLNVQQNQRGDVQLRAPHAGVITAVLAETGQVVSVGQPIVRLAQHGPRDVVFAVPEQAAGQLKPGQVMAVDIPAQAFKGEGRIREIAASADPVTRTYEVRLALPPEDQPPLGATATIVHTVKSAAADRAEQVKVPLTAVHQKGQQAAVWVFDAATQTVRSVGVSLGVAEREWVQILSGLTPGQSIVATGGHILTEGQKVTPYESKP
jgi:RND family efflux transporter MFP subunit